MVLALRRRLVSSGGLLFDLFAGFPDYPHFDPAKPNSKIRQRLAGDNYRGVTCTAGWDSLKKMLAAFADEQGGRVCDYIGWHPHFSWRVIDQEFRLIRAMAGNLPIFIDDMWCHLFARGYAGGLLIPGEAQFAALPWPQLRTDWVQAINGDFPNRLFTSLDPFAELFQKLQREDSQVTAWYNKSGSHRLVKSVVTALGEGAERVCVSEMNDYLRGFDIGWLNMLGTRQEQFEEKPAFYTYQLLIGMLQDFTSAERVPISCSPLTRCYCFHRPAGPTYVLWSDTGTALPSLNYSTPNGETWRPGYILLNSKEQQPQRTR